ncbi:F-box/kelch-repeat protein At3g06240-like [Papaver somniferum]|uniref:F-box/kelch-repeat protein At3g06240-like n=1 Tax=Papaver somniferum TaxID=3469 RepID=UPI000E6FD300|nr:F-box/kelch-repeat protein At3g06240-like [Papaver somniferum]
MAMIEKWKFLPEGILMDILTWLPVKSVLRFSIILSKQEPTLYYSDEPYTASFPSLDYNISTSTFDMSVEYHCPFHYWKCYIRILGICNGLFCLRSDPELLLVSVPTHGFGYGRKTGDYKVVKIITAGSDRFSQVRVYTLGTGSLRALENILYVFYLPGRANGVLHWLVHPCNRGKNTVRVILSFDVGDEKFKEMQLPIPLCGAPEGDKYYKTSIGLLDGKLCLSWYVGDGNVDVWIMQNYGVIESWTKIFSVSRLKEDIDFVRPVQSFKNGDILLFGQPLNRFNPHNGDLFLYNPMNGNARFLDTSSYQTLEKVHTYVGSLVSVKSICDAGEEVVVL